MEMNGFQTWPLRIVVLLLTLNGINCLPVVDNTEDPVTQLKQLAAKLVIVEQALEDLNQDINSYVTSAKHLHSGPTQHVIKSTKRSSLSAPHVAAPNTDQTLDNFMLQLSPEDQAVLQHMQSKMKYLQAALHEPVHSPNPGEEAPNTQVQKKSQIPNNVAREFHLVERKRSHVPNPSVPAEESDQELQTFKQQLSPEDQELLKKMSYKLKFLQGTLHEPAHGPNPNEAPDVTIQKKSEIHVNKAREFELVERKRSHVPNPSVPAEESDQELQTFKQQLSPEDQELLKKMGYKLKYLQGVLHEPARGPNPNETPDVQIMKKSVVPNGADQSVNEDEILDNYIASLSPEDQALLKKNKNKLQLLQAVLHESKQAPNPGENTAKAKREQLEQDVEELEEVQEKTDKKLETTAGSANDGVPAATDNAIIFTANDREMLQTIRVKLDELKKSLQEFKTNYPPAQASVQRVVKPEVMKTCENCDCEDEDCVCGCECTGDCTDSVTKLSKRVLSKVNSGATSGINLKQLLSALSHVKTVRQRRHINLEQEVDETRGRGGQ